MMERDRNQVPVICISPGINGRWDVSEKESEEPLASFDEKEDAYDYATDLTASKQGATVLIEDEVGFSPLPFRRGGGASERNDGHIAGWPRVPGTG
ncbi:hypothetical protein [Noviherbaspirillum sp. UKPF54]|uniref:hypothetical protein n=1 Tax=Noviherbaspirillum sp. UKPF54 TaxID=2601898 RepID=UPI0011B18D2C|nr:hypothetical protein [Noviherbaspirillum sp. UKPF54]QDZ26905.1 hypothetical protein FAY22_02360 [Noviherbaspirillum sp. UKPF54]